jgi:hypothetical protein
MPDGKAKNPFGKNKGGKKGGPPIAAGAWVSWGNQRGKVDLVVTNGKVPGVEQDVTGTADKPAARVVVYEPGAGGKWKATGKKVGVSQLQPQAQRPVHGGFGKKDLDDRPRGGPRRRPDGLLRGPTRRLRPHSSTRWPSRPSTSAAWSPGPASTPVSRTRRGRWAGRRRSSPRRWRRGQGLRADRDLLPEGHPLAVKAASMSRAGRRSAEVEGKDDPEVVVRDRGEGRRHGRRGRARSTASTLMTTRCSRDARSPSASVHGLTATRRP